MPHPTLIRLAGDGSAWNLRGPDGPLRIENLRAAREDECLLLPHLPLPQGLEHLHLTLAGGSPLLPAVCAALRPGCRVSVFELDQHEARLLRDKLAPFPNVDVRCATDPEPATATAQAAILPLRRDTDRLLAFDLIERLDRILPAGSPVAVLLPRRRLADLRRRLEAHLAGLERHAEDRASTVCAGRSRGHGDAWSERRALFTATTATDQARLCSRPGVFAHGRPDAGGLALAEAATPLAAPGQRVLDLGCGCGIAGLLVAAAMHRLAAGTPVPGDVLLVDSNARAVACATAGAAMNGFAFVRVAHDDRWQPVAAEFDLVLGNPPYFAAGRIAEAFTDTAWRALRPAGRLLLVSKHGAALAEAAAARGFAVEARRRRGYDLTLATRPGAGDP